MIYPNRDEELDPMTMCDDEFSDSDHKEKEQEDLTQNIIKNLHDINDYKFLKNER